MSYNSRIMRSTGQRLPRCFTFHHRVAAQYHFAHSKAAINGSQWLILHSGEKRRVAQFDYLITTIAAVAHSKQRGGSSRAFLFVLCPLPNTEDFFFRGRRIIRNSFLAMGKMWRIKFNWWQVAGEEIDSGSIGVELTIRGVQLTLNKSASDQVV